MSIRSAMESRPQPAVAVTRHPAGLPCAHHHVLGHDPPHLTRRDDEPARGVTVALGGLGDGGSETISRGSLSAQETAPVRWPQAVCDRAVWASPMVCFPRTPTNTAFLARRRGNPLPRNRGLGVSLWFYAATAGQGSRLPTYLGICTGDKASRRMPR